MNDVYSRTRIAEGTIYVKAIHDSFVLLYPNVLLEGWNVEKVSERYEGEKWGTFWFQVVTPTGMFRVKEFFSI